MQQFSSQDLPMAIMMLLVLFLTLGVARADYWGDWSSWSECSRTCDGGATYQERKCVRSFHNPNGCDGDRYRYNTCNTKACAPGVLDFRSEQCAAYNNQTYGGVLYNWGPYTDRKNPCALYCIAKGQRTVVRLAPKVLDGTRCKQKGTFDMCISGKCWVVGCDFRLGSKLKLDLCGVCGGNNSCLTATRTRKGHFQWREAGLSHCSASCGQGVQKSVFHCFDTLRNRQVNERRCARTDRPSGRKQHCFRRRCPPAWKIFPWQPCSASCGGGLRSRAVRCMDTLSDGRQQWLHNSFCPHPHPTVSQPCNKHICPRWFAGQWSPCSVTCGWGRQEREVVCRHEGDNFCIRQDKPRTARNCTTNFPCLDKRDPRYIAERQISFQRQALSVGEMQKLDDDPNVVPDVSVVKEEDVKKHNMSVPRFVVSAWSPCSATCGQGDRKRYVRCQVRLQFMGDIVDVVDQECEGPKPIERENCNLDPCFRDFEYRKMGMTECDRSCRGGTQETIVQCFNKRNDTRVDESNCREATPIPVERRICNNVPCPQRWRIGDFSTCSATCGGGMMKRDVKCVQDYVTKVLPLPDNMCKKPIPARVRECNTQFCPADWATGFWSACSATCGVGEQLRPVVCQRVSRDGTPVDVDRNFCPPTEIPASEQACNLTACPTVRIRRHDVNFFQLNKIDRVRLMVGAEAAILPGTSVVVSCPVRGFQKKHVEWLKNGRPLRRSRHAHVSSKGKLRIRRSRPDRDTANYTCIAGTQKASLQVLFSDYLEVIGEMALREKYLGTLVGLQADSPVSNNVSAYHKDPFDREKRPLHVVTHEWGACSATCDGGIQRRKVTCEIITRDYFETFPSRVCRKAKLPMPKDTAKCNVEACLTWKTTPWSRCSAEHCVREGQASQTRDVSCTVIRNSTVVRDHLCTGARPQHRRLCQNKKCIPKWKTSEWSACSADCGGSGVKMRMLTCVWAGSGLPAGRACQGLTRPVLTVKCRRDDCATRCFDESSYCNVVKRLKLCRYANFKTKCCKTCRPRRRKNG